MMGLTTASAWACSRARENRSTIAWQKAGRSAGERLVMRLTVDDDLLVDDFGAGVAQVGPDARPGRHPPPRTTSASTSVHGPWQIAATGLPLSTNALTNSTASWFMRS